jgi:hypothetical protein
MQAVSLVVDGVNWCPFANEAFPDRIVQSKLMKLLQEQLTAVFELLR